MTVVSACKRTPFLRSAMGNGPADFAAPPLVEFPGFVEANPDDEQPENPDMPCQEMRNGAANDMTNATATRMTE